MEESDLLAGEFNRRIAQIFSGFVAMELGLSAKPKDTPFELEFRNKWSISFSYKWHKNHIKNTQNRRVRNKLHDEADSANLKFFEML